MNNLLKHLKGGDLRSIAEANKAVSLIKTQKDFDELFNLLFSKDRLIVMRAADAIEKITLKNPEYLEKYNQELINLINNAVDKELKWHLALIAPRLNLTIDESIIVWRKLTNWAKDKNESKIVRVNSIQALFDLANKNEELKKDFDLTIQEIETENIPSIKARLKKIGCQKQK
ncbi:MAG: hypothetical protein CSB21_01560 [Deltaproteobacteria bacterium]|nr:MAG: hypothetical protein CSB21_01560 [Deltaproteobacteria bacterium]